MLGRIKVARVLAVILSCVLAAILLFSCKRPSQKAATSDGEAVSAASPVEAATSAPLSGAARAMRSLPIPR